VRLVLGHGECQVEAIVPDRGTGLRECLEALDSIHNGCG